MNRRLLIMVFLYVCVACSSVALLWAGDDDAQRQKLFDSYRATEGDVRFFGKVVDQNGMPIEGANVVVSVPTPDSWLRPIMTDREKTFTTDKNGLFEVSKRSYAVASLKSAYLYVKRITKDEYEGDWIRDANGVFCYSTSNSQRFIPDPLNPIIYTLRKKGETTFLFQETQIGFEISVDKSGETRSYDFIKRHKIKDANKPLLNGEPLYCDLLVKARFSTNNAAWAVVLSPGNTNGGIIVSEHLLFEAPDAGYQSEYTFTVADQMKVSVTTPTKTKYVYLKSRNPAIYTRYEIENITACKEFFRLGGKSVTNPYGDRNLEQATDLPYEVVKRLTDEAKAAHRQGKRPEKPDLQKLIKEAKDKAGKDKPNP